MPVEMKDEAVTARKGVAYNGYAHSFGGMGVQFILFMGIDSGIGMLLQRQRGLWKRFRAAPLSKSPFCWGAGRISAAVIAHGDSARIFSASRGSSLGVRIEGSMAGFLAGVGVAFSLMTASVRAAGRGSWQDARSDARSGDLRHADHGDAGRGVGAGIYFPQWLQKITIVIPTRWAMDGLDGVVWRGMGFHDVLAPCAVLILYAAIFGLIAVRRFRWEAEG